VKKLSEKEMNEFLEDIRTLSFDDREKLLDLLSDLFDRYIAILKSLLHVAEMYCKIYSFLIEKRIRLPKILKDEMRYWLAFRNSLANLLADANEWREFPDELDEILDIASYLENATLGDVWRAIQEALKSEQD